MATPKSQRIAIWIIAVVMLVGTIGSFAVIILSINNGQKDQEALNKMLEEQKKQQEAAQKKQKEEAAKLSATYYPQFSPYRTAPAVFEPGAVDNKVAVNDLIVGAGEEITKDAKYQAYYIGWNPKGRTFDSSFDGDSLKMPLDTSDISLIKGWEEGVIGMKVGGVREITIPSDLAYGETGQGDAIPPNTPIKFIVMIIAKK